MAEATSVEIDGEQVRITSPDRVVFPRQDWTKLDVVNHFRTVSEGCLRGVFGRPTMMKRYMKDVETDPIYHKRASKNTPFETAPLRFPSQRPGRMNVPRTRADILRLVQLGCLDLHPWPVRAEDLYSPDELRLDFDPTDGFSFADVKQAAMRSRDLLEEVGLVGWPKTSGSRGIHVYIRIKPHWDFYQTRRAVLAFGREMERRYPEVVTTKWWKEERRGVFIDYNQNAWDKTVSSAYGVRPTGFVSAPLTWDELPDVEIEDFPLDQFARRYETVGDLTDGIDEQAGGIEPLLEWVARDEADGIGDAPWPPNYPKMPGEPPRVQPSRMVKANWE
ncbi:MAG: ATP-dependent DNA ligase [Acidimicrobiia bacterium]|nr:ATP-dependent DNA ligase [Acidimicrobiia bacterium]